MGRIDTIVDEWVNMTHRSEHLQGKLCENRIKFRSSLKKAIAVKQPPSLQKCFLRLDFRHFIASLQAWNLVIPLYFPDFGLCEVSINPK